MQVTTVGTRNRSEQRETRGEKRNKKERISKKKGRI